VKGIESKHTVMGTGWKAIPAGGYVLHDRPSWSPPYWISIYFLKWEGGRVICHSGLEFN